MRRMIAATAFRVLTTPANANKSLTRPLEAATKGVLPSYTQRATSTAAAAAGNVLPRSAVAASIVSPASGIFSHPQRFRHVVAHAAATSAPEETFTYQAEVDRLMDMIVHSLYSNRDVFLRELISNASDALDKERFVSLTKNQPSISDSLEIKVKGDKENNVIIIEDNGIGMTRDDLLSSLGTIARSGTAKFMEAIKESQGDANLIGQFGVGFYSAFLVAERVRVETKADADDKQWAWESAAGSHQFTIKESDGAPLQRGTRLTLFLKEDAYEYADDKRLQGLIKQYSEFISFPISLYTSQQQRKDVVDDEATAKKQQEADEQAAKDGKEESTEKVDPVMKTEYETVWDYTVQNDTKPLWLRTPREVSKDEYDTFFKGTFKEFMDPAAYNHFTVEGTIEFTGLLFIPGMAPFDQGDPNSLKSRNIRLYVKRVFISDEFDENLMPRYLSFIKGIVDSSDLPLNVSREILQESRVVKVMRKQLVKRSLDMIENLSKSEDDKAYPLFWESFGRNLKLGIIEDPSNKAVLSKLLRFSSSQAGDDLTSLSEYASRMKEGQKGIYYMAADSKAAAAQAPFVEKLIAKGLEVLYLVEPIDEVCMANLTEFDGHKLIDVTREELEVDEDDEKKAKEAASKYKDLTEFMKKTLEEKVEKVVVSSRLADSPCALVTSKFGWSANMERIMKSQAMQQDTKAMEYMRGRKTLEINPEHPVIVSLNKMQADSNSKGAARSMVKLLYDTALVTSGFNVESPKEFAKRIYDMIGAVAQATDEVEQEEAAGASPAAASSSSGSGNGSSSSNGGRREPEVVTAEVVEDVNTDDPWRQKGSQK